MIEYTVKADVFLYGTMLPELYVKNKEITGSKALPSSSISSSTV